MIYERLTEIPKGTFGFSRHPPFRTAQNWNTSRKKSETNFLSIKTNDLFQYQTKLLPLDFL